MSNEFGEIAPAKFVAVLYNYLANVRCGYHVPCIYFKNTNKFRN